MKSLFDRIYAQLSADDRAEADKLIALLPEATPRPEGTTLNSHSSDNHWPHKTCYRCRLEALEVALGNLGRQDLMVGLDEA